MASDLPFYDQHFHLKIGISLNIFCYLLKSGRNSEMKGVLHHPQTARSFVYRQRFFGTEEKGKKAIIISFSGDYQTNTSAGPASAAVNDGYQ